MGDVGRLNEELLERATEFGVRVLRVVDHLERDRRPRRVCDQLVGSGLAPGAHLSEANEALSRADFIKTLGWAAKELSETRYWLTIIQRAKWLEADRLADLQEEALALLKIVKTIIARSRRARLMDQ